MPRTPNSATFDAVVNFNPSICTRRPRVLHCGCLNHVPWDYIVLSWP